MTKVSDRLNRLSESATLAMARMSRELKAEGKDVMSQLRVVLDRIVKIVQAEGGLASDIVSMTTYIVDTKMSQFLLNKSNKLATRPQMPLFTDIQRGTVKV